jgi:hypothetical protein
MVMLFERYLIFTTGDMQNKFTCIFLSAKNEQHCWVHWCKLLKEKSIGHYAYFPSGITPDWPLCGMELFFGMIVNFTYIEGKYLSVVLLYISLKFNWLCFTQIYSNMIRCNVKLKYVFQNISQRSGIYRMDTVVFRWNVLWCLWHSGI